MTEKKLSKKVTDLGIPKMAMLSGALQGLITIDMVLGTQDPEARKEIVKAYEKILTIFDLNDEELLVDDMQTV